MDFSPVKASKNIVEKYKRYLRTIFEISDRKYAQQFEKKLNNENYFAKGPYLEVTDVFVKGESLEELIKKGVLAKGFSRLQMPQTRPLYQHQVDAISKVLNGKNIVVSTGTGSGKTESFLIPIFNHLIRQQEENKLNPGVRALIIYPMNALANDQIERLRGILCDYPQITYGSYTGQTRQKHNDALVEYKKLNNGEEPPKNELISRERMKENPPHILITNYAMLEYLMVRPDDNVFFDGRHAENWEFIVLDEAHIYNGSTGIEVSMLLRRLKAKLKNKNIRYILTSATLGGENDNVEVAQFAQNLCASNFNENDVIRAERIKLEPAHELTVLPVSFYNETADLIRKQEEKDKIATRICTQLHKNQQGPLEEVLYNVVLQDENYWRLRKHLRITRTVSDLARFMNWTQAEVENFVVVASKCEKNGDRLFEARYHMFLRATESVFITLPPSNQLFLIRKLSHFEGNEEYKVFEIATCSSCHVIYLVGRVEGNYLQQASFVGEDDIKTLFLLGNSISDSDEDHMLEDENIGFEEYELCSLCGLLCRSGRTGEPHCHHDQRFFVTVFKVETKNPSHTLTKCLCCENTNNHGILRMFFSGQEASTSVIGTALFEELPSYSIKQEIVLEEDDTGFGLNGLTQVTTKTNKAKQFIAFSDSRQAAAFFSSYFDRTYRNILYKRLIVETLKDQVYSTRGKTVNDFVEDLIYQFEKYNVADRNSDVTRKEAWKAALHEIVDNNGNTSLFSLGLLGLSLNNKDIPENRDLNLKSSEVATICSVMAMGIMTDAAVSYAANLNKADKEYFTHNGVEYTYTLSDPNPRALRRSFIPVNINKTNKRLDYFIKVLKKTGKYLSDERTKEILEKGIWKIFCKVGFFKAIDSKYRIDAEKIIVSKPEQWYICPKCKKITIHNVLKVCPSFKCDGELRLICLEDAFADNHYYRMYQELDIRELRVVEHTAQLNKEMAYEYQKKFQRKEIDVLSCSTTFEMGVDVGSLETVFMRNVPPSPANYAQRAGRAGRSKQSAAYALTFCNKSSHDFYFFNSPEKMIKGKIAPPKFNVENDKIAIRHLYASALAFFWKKRPEYFAKTSNMMEDLSDKQSGYELFNQYINTHPADLQKYLNSFLPDKLSKKFDVDSFGWVKGLICKEPEEEGVFTKAVLEYNYEVNTLKEALERAIAAERNSYNLIERIRVYRNENILSFLSRKNVLPKYGFPVDTVELTIFDKTNRTKLGLQLQRDLAMAISEYAPDSQIVANGNLITSRYIKKIPNMSWKQFDYIKCECKTLNIAQHVEEDEFSELNCCKQCGESFNVANRKVFLIPEFGFEADGDKIKKPGLRKPKKTYRGEVAYVGYKNNIELHQYQIGKAVLELGMSQADEMAVLNEANFFVCESCGYTVLEKKEFKKSKWEKHNKPSGYPCYNDRTNRLKKFALGYRFKTDVLQLKFINPDLMEWEIGLSVLYGVLRGISSYLNIEENDISGCLQYFYNGVTNRPNFELVLFDKTPGGAGHVKRLNNRKVLEGVLHQSLALIEQCDCGGDEKDSSCYTCLRGYYNQKNHDILKRSYVIDFINKIFN